MTERSRIPGWDDRYAGEGYLFGTVPNDFLVAMAPRLAAASRVLCLADGEGRNGVYLAEQGHHVTSIDASETGVMKTRELATERGVSVETEVADLTQRDLGTGKWDAIVSIFFHLPSAIRAPLHQRVVDALRPGGLMILEAYTPAQLDYGTGGPPVADNLMTLAALGEELASLEFEHALETERSVLEGTGHTGLASVVQVVARKPG